MEDYVGAVEMLDVADGVFDPQLSPDGSAVAYVAGRALRMVDAEGDRLVMEEDDPDVSWGSAEFITGEEMGRTRGFWWSPDGDALLVERVDVGGVDQWWISAPVSPDVAPTPIRYPAAGTANAVVGLAVLGREGARVDLDGALEGWEYLANAAWDAEGIWLTVQSRDQRTQIGRASWRERV